MSGKRPGQKPAKKKVDPEKLAAKRERRAQAKALREAQRRKEQRKKLLIQIGVLAAVAVVAVGVTIAIMKSSEPEKVPAPAGFADDGSITVGDPDAEVVVTLVEDFACPHCAALHQETKDLLDGYAAGDEVKVEYRPIGFVTDYSPRALNAAICAVEDAPESWTPMHDALFENQPAEGDSLSDGQLTSLAVEAGADEQAVSTCIADNDHENWVDYITHTVRNEKGFSGTPRIKVDGQDVASTREDIDAAVQDALGS